MVARSGYQLWVTAETFSGEAYKFLWGQRQTILQALWVSVYVTFLGTVIGVALTCLLGYVLSRKEHVLNGFLTIMVFIPMVFGGGMAASYVVNPQILGLKDNMWVLILPLAVSSWNCTIARTFFKSTIPDSIIESAKIDGASRLQIIKNVCLPHLKPTIVTLLILRIGSIMSLGFDKAWLLQNPLNIEGSSIIATYTYQVGMLDGQMSYSAAIGLFNNIINIILVTMANKASKKLTETSLW